MSRKSVCRVCLVDDMNLYSVRNDLQNVYERIANEKYYKVGYPVHMCYVCLTVLWKCHRFMETARDTNNVLKQWHNQQNEMRVARPLYTYSISKAEFISTYNGNITQQNDIKVEKVESELEEVQPDNPECSTDGVIEKTDMDEQTDCSELMVDSPNANTDTVEDTHDRQTDPLFHSNIDFEEISNHYVSNWEDHTNIESKIKIPSPHDNDAPPVKNRKTNETKPQHQAPETLGETAANSETSNDITHMATPSQPHNTRYRNTKTKPTFNKNNQNSKKTAILKKKKKTRLNKELPKNIVKNSKKSALDASNIDKNEIITLSCKTTVTQYSTTVSSNTNKKPFKCDICNYNCTKSSRLAEHMRTHTGEKPFSCDICDYKCGQKGSLNIHMRTHTGVKPYSCDICDYKCSLKANLERHIRYHTGVKPFSCSMCDYKSVAKSYLIQHTRIHTDEKPFSCDICDYKCGQKGSLNIHMRTHTGVKPYSCDICDYKFTLKCNLENHMSTHTGEKPFSCDICDYKFRLKVSLENHMSTHTGVKPFSCDICDYKCSKKANLERHIRYHTGVKPFSCSMCDYKSVAKSSLIQHTRIHTDEKPFSCDICDYKCRQHSHLKLHLLTKHVNNKRK